MIFASHVYLYINWINNNIINVNPPNFFLHQIMYDWLSFQGCLLLINLKDVTRHMSTSGNS